MHSSSFFSLIHIKNIIQLHILLPTGNKQLKGILGLLSLWAWNGLQGKKKLNNTKEEIVKK